MTSQASISNVLNYLLKRTGISESELARKIELPRNTINRLTAAKTPDPRISTLEAIAGYFQITLEQLLGKLPITENSLNLNDGIKHIPIIDIEKVSQWEEIISDITPTNHHEWVLIESSSSEAKFSTIIRGDAMWPQFQEGNIAIIDPHKIPQNRDYVIVKISSTDEIIFRQLFSDNSLNILKAINTLFPHIALTNEDKIIGTVVETRIRH